MSEASKPFDHEHSDANARLLAAIAAGIAVFVIGTPLLLIVLFPGADRRGAIQGELKLPPEPRLQVNARADLAKLRAREEQALNSYGWVDRNNGVVRIPIERAMQLLAQRGLPDWQAQPERR